MYQSAHPNVYHAGYADPNRGRYESSCKQNMASSNVPSSLPSPDDCPPPLIPITQSVESLGNQKTTHATPSPPILTIPSHATINNPGRSAIVNMASFVNQHAYAAVWQTTSIACQYPVAQNAVPQHFHQQQQLPYQQGPLQRNGIPTSRMQLHAQTEPSRLNPVSMSQAARQNPHFRTSMVQNNNTVCNTTNGNRNNLLLPHQIHPQVGNIHSQTSEAHMLQMPKENTAVENAPNSFSPAVPSIPNSCNNNFQKSQSIPSSQQQLHPVIAKQQQTLPSRCFNNSNNTALSPMIPEQVPGTSTPSRSEGENLVVPNEHSRKEDSTVPVPASSCSLMSANTAHEQTILNSTGTDTTIPKKNDQSDSLSRNQLIHSAYSSCEPVSKRLRAVVESSLTQAAPTVSREMSATNKTNTSGIRVETPSSSQKDEENWLSLPEFKRFQTIIENPFIIQEIVMLEKQRINTPQPNLLEIEWEPRNANLLYQAIDVGRFRRIFTAGRVTIRWSETNFGPVAFAVHPDDGHRYESNSTDIRETLISDRVPPVIFQLLNSVEPAERFKSFVLLAHREYRCWELAGCLEPLNSQNTETETQQVKGAIGNQTQTAVLDQANQTSCDNTMEAANEDTCSADNDTEQSEGSSQSFENASDIEALKLAGGVDVGDVTVVHEQQSLVRTVPTTKIFSCQVCQKFFTSKKYFKRHMKIHEQPQELASCNICNKKFSSKASLRKHGVTHRNSHKNLFNELVNQILTDQNGNNSSCPFCKTMGGCLCFKNSSTEEDLDLDSETRPVQLVTLEKLRNLLHSGKLLVRLNEKEPDTLLILRPDNEERFEANSVDIRLVEDVGRLSAIAADLVNRQNLPEYSTKCAMLIYDAALQSWKLAGCLQPKISRSSISSATPSTSKADNNHETPEMSTPTLTRADEPPDILSPSRAIDPSSLVQCVVESPEKTSSSDDNSLDKGEMPVFTNPLAQESLQDIALNHLMTLIPQNELTTLDVSSSNTPPSRSSLSKYVRICKVCFKVLRSNRSFVQHQLTHNPNLKILECSFCDFVTTRRFSLKQHISKRHTDLKT